MSQLTTTAGDYSDNYYFGENSSYEDYSWETPKWRDFFRGIADRLTATTNPASVLDIGCARGLLVQAFVERGINAHGADISDSAIAAADPDIRDRLSVASATEPLVGTWDLITCIETLEHMSQSDVEKALDNICSATDRFLFSSTPGEFTEPTHVNVRQPAAWAASMAERGFYRRTDVDVSFLSPWAVLYERATPLNRDVVFRYENFLYPLRVEVLDKRSALLDAHRIILEQQARLDGSHPDESRPRSASPELQQVADERLAHIRELEKQIDDGRAREQALHDELGKANAATEQIRSDRDAVSAELFESRHRLLSVRDHAIGAEAAAATAKAQRDGLEAELKNDLREAEKEAEAYKDELDELKAQLETLRGTTRWRVGGIVLGPGSAIKRRIRDL